LDSEKQGQEENGDTVKDIPQANCWIYAMRTHEQGNCREQLDVGNTAEDTKIA
jgi:hypothetical protein